MRKWYPLFLVAAMLVVGVVLYPRLPDTMPTSWTMQGHPDGMGPKWQALFVMPLVMLGMLALLRLLPIIDPRRDNYVRMQAVYDLIVNAILTMMAAIQLLGIAVVMGAPLSQERLTPALIGVMLVIMGNVLPLARPNWFVGIRTPWTLSSDRVWERTHRIGGYLMVASGVVAIAVAALPFPVSFPALGVVSATAGLVPVIYSYIAWKQEKAK